MKLAQPQIPPKKKNRPREGVAEEGLGGIPLAGLPAEVSTQAGASQFRSDIFKNTPLN